MTSAMMKLTAVFIRSGHDAMTTVWAWSLTLHLLHSLPPCYSVSNIHNPLFTETVDDRQEKEIYLQRVFKN